MGRGGEGKRNRPVLAVYCRCPEAERVKTRLGSTIGEERARQFYTLCLDLLRKELPLLAGTFDLAVCPSRAEDRDWAARAFPAATHIMPQAPGRLGMRIEATVRGLRSIGYGRLLLIGSDAPSLPLPYLRLLHRLLRRSEVVLGPAEDGGVYAIGTRVPLTGLGAIHWSTGAVFRELVAAIVRSDSSVGIGPPWYDVDTARDARRARDDLLHAPSLARQQLGRWVDSVLPRGRRAERLVPGLVFPPPS